MIAKRLKWMVAAALMGGSLFGTFGTSGRALAVERPYNFVEIAEQGFGDRQNTKAWSMAWWKDHLYVGTARAHLCMNWAGLSLVRDRWEYPPRSFVDPGGTDPDLDCTPDFRDLPLQAEIWRYSPRTNEWTRVFQSELIQNPADPTRETARDIGIRNLDPLRRSGRNGSAVRRRHYFGVHQPGDAASPAAPVGGRRALESGAPGPGHGLR